MSHKENKVETIYVIHTVDEEEVSFKLVGEKEVEIGIKDGSDYYPYTVNLSELQEVMRALNGE